MAYNYPKFEKSDFSEEFFGHILPDPYCELKQALNPKVLDWVKQENEFTDRWFDQKELADKIAELKSQKRRPLYTQIGMWNGKLTATKPQDGNFKLVCLDQQMQNEELLFERDTVPNYTASSLRACPSDQKLLMVHGLYDGDPRLTVRREKSFPPFGIPSAPAGRRTGQSFTMWIPFRIRRHRPVAPAFVRMMFTPIPFGC